MELDELLAQALEAVKRANIPAALQEIAFSKAVDILSGGPQRPPAEADRTEGSKSDEIGGDGGSPTRLSAIAKFFGLDLALVEDHFSEHDGNLRIEVDPLKLGTSTSDQARGLATLLITGRQIGGYDSGATPISAIRKECERHGVYDSGNFSTHMNKIAPFFAVVGERNNRTFKVKPASREEAKNVFAKVTGQ